MPAPSFVSVTPSKRKKPPVSDNQQMTFVGAVWHVTDGTIDLIFRSQEVPPRPDWVREDQWYGGPGETISLTAPARKPVVAPSTGIGVTGTNPDGSPQFTRYTWNAATQSWTNPVRVDAQGNPL